MQEKVEFTNSRGEKLAGIIHHPDVGTVRAAALFAHCFTCTKNILAAVQIADALASGGDLKAAAAADLSISKSRYVSAWEQLFSTGVLSFTDFNSEGKE